jgi:hypothetical protein
VPEVAAVEGPDVRLVNQANAIAELFDFEPLIARNDFHKQFLQTKKTGVATDATPAEESIKSL